MRVCVYVCTCVCSPSRMFVCVCVCVMRVCAYVCVFTYAQCFQCVVSGSCAIMVSVWGVFLCLCACMCVKACEALVSGGYNVFFGLSIKSVLTCRLEPRHAFPVARPSCCWCLCPGFGSPWSLSLSQCFCKFCE